MGWAKARSAGGTLGGNRLCFIMIWLSRVSHGSERVQ